MSLCIIHVDGSFYSASTSTKKSGLGWGIVAEHDDQTHEACGGYAVSKNQGLNGAHEDIALLHALAYMRNHGFSPQNTHMYCDDQLMGHAPTYLAKENFLGYKAELIERRVTRAAQFIGQEALVPQIMQELQDVCLHKVKGHQGHVYQERVDYLAAQRACRLRPTREHPRYRTGGGGQWRTNGQRRSIAGRFGVERPMRGIGLSHDSVQTERAHPIRTFRTNIGRGGHRALRT